MTVIKRGNSYWIDIGFNHRRIRKRSPENSFNGAKSYELLIRGKLARGEPLEEPKLEVNYTFKEVAWQWLETYVKNNNKPSEAKNKGYITHLRLIPYFGNTNIKEISGYKIEQFKTYLLREKSLSPKSVNNYVSILSRCLRSAHEWEMIETVPKIKLLKVPPQKYDYLTEQETEQLLEHSEGQLHDMVLLAVKTGLRFGELIALRWEDIDLKQNILTVNKNIVRGIEGSPKNNKTRTIPLTLSVIQMLKRKRPVNKYVFTNKDGLPLIHDYCRDHLHASCRKAGLRNIGWHSLRHSFASHLASKGVSIVAIKELMGHSDIKTTMRYAHINLPVLQNAIETLEPAFQINGTMTPQIETGVMS